MGALEDDEVLHDELSTLLSVLLEDISELDVLTVVVTVIVVLVSELDCGSLTGGSLSIGADEIGSSVEAGEEYSTDSELSVLLSEDVLSGGVSAVLCIEVDVDEDTADIVEDVDDADGGFGTAAVN